MYKLTNNTSIIRKHDNASIPADDGNTDYQAYLVWVAEGNVAEVADIFVQPNPRKAEIIKEIEVIEKKKLRSMSDIVGGNPDKTDVTGKTSKEYFDEYEVQLETLRAELVAL